MNHNGNLDYILLAGFEYWKADCNKYQHLIHTKIQTILLCYWKRKGVGGLSLRYKLVIFTCKYP